MMIGEKKRQKDRPGDLPESLLSEGIKDLILLENWGDYLAYDPKWDEKMEYPRSALTSSQIRRFFGALKRIQADWDNQKGEVLLLVYKLAYAVGRDKNERGQNKSKILDFFEQLNSLLRKINEDKAQFNNFVKIVEAMVAYHKAYGGK